MEAALRLADVALPTFDDEARLFGDRSLEETVERLSRLGISEIVVKNGDKPCLVAAQGVRELVPPITPERVVDTTGAGDSFGGAYLAARLTGLGPADAARTAHAAAALFPWFAMARNWISIVSHIAFGLVLAWSYMALVQRRHPR